MSQPTQQSVSSSSPRKRTFLEETTTPNNKTPTHSSSNGSFLQFIERDGYDVYHTSVDPLGKHPTGSNESSDEPSSSETNKQEPAVVVASPTSFQISKEENPLDDKLVTLVFGVDGNTRSETLARKFAQVSLLVADMLEFMDDEDKPIVLNLPNVPLNAVDPIVDYMKYEIFLKVDEQTPLDINSDYLNVEVPIEAQGELREEDKEFLSRWNNSHILEATVAAANYLNMKRLLDLVLFGVARWMYERRENISTIIHTDFSGFPDNVPDKEEKRKLVETFKKYARPSPIIV